MSRLRRTTRLRSVESHPTTSFAFIAAPKAPIGFFLPIIKPRLKGRRLQLGKNRRRVVSFTPRRQLPSLVTVVGRFLCTVCDIHIGQNHLCTSCLQAGKNPLAVAKLDNEQVLHDNITLSIALVAPFAFWPVVPFTAPIRSLSRNPVL